MQYYLRFWSRYNPWQPLCKGPRTFQTPGNLFDKDPRKRFKHKFKRWYDRPEAAKRLHWKLHPEYRNDNATEIQAGSRL